MTAIDRDLNLLHAHIGIFDRRNLLRIDWLLAGFTFALAIIGFIVLYSASTGPVSVDYPHFKQAGRFLVGLALALVIVCMDYRVLVSLGPTFYVLSVASLVTVLFYGTEVKGGQHWLVIYGPIRFQPSELSKLALVCMLAWYLSRVGIGIRKLHFFLLTFGVWGAVTGLVVIQGDLGTAITMVPIIFAMLFAAGCRKRHVALVIAIGAALAPVAYSQLEPHQRSRIDTFFRPGKADANDTFQSLQAKIAIGSGQMWGKGFGESTQTHLSYLPEFHTDFVFALLAEEQGFVGAITVIGLFALFLLRGMTLAASCPDPAGGLLSIGAIAILACHIVVNIAITLNLMPVTGLPLPFLSYGGSFYLTTMMCVGLILCVHARRRFFD